MECSIINELCGKLRALSRQGSTLSAELPKDQGDINFTRKTIKDPSTVYCHLHPDNKINLYCINCKLAICMTCVQYHKGHRLSDCMKRTANDAVNVTSGIDKYRVMLERVTEKLKKTGVQIVEKPQQESTLSAELLKTQGDMNLTRKTKESSRTYCPIMKSGVEIGEKFETFEHESTHPAELMKQQGDMNLTRKAKESSRTYCPIMKAGVEIGEKFEHGSTHPAELMKQQVDMNLTRKAKESSTTYYPIMKTGVEIGDKFEQESTLPAELLKKQGDANLTRKAKESSTTHYPIMKTGVEIDEEFEPESILPVELLKKQGDTNLTRRTKESSTTYYPLAKTGVEIGEEFEQESAVPAKLPKNQGDMKWSAKTKESSTKYCPLHQDKKIKIYCNDCKIATCMMCIVTFHIGHRLSGVGKQIANDVGKVASRIDRCRETLERLRDARNDLPEQVEETGVEIGEDSVEQEFAPPDELTTDDGDTNSVQEVKDSLEIYCREHRDEMITTYCTECRMAFCEMCVNYHRGHRLSDVVEQMSNDVDKVSSGIDRCREMLERVEKAEYDVAERVEKTEVEIDENVEQLKQMIDAHRTELVNELSTVKENKMNEIRPVREAIETRLYSMDGYRNDVDDVRYNGADGDIAELHDRADELLNFDGIGPIPDDLGHVDITFMSSNYNFDDVNKTLGKLTGAKTAESIHFYNSFPILICWWRFDVAVTRWS